MRLGFLLPLVVVSSFAACEARADVVHVTGTSGAVLEELAPDGRWSRVCSIPCEADVNVHASHRVVDGAAPPMTVRIHRGAREVHYARGNLGAGATVGVAGGIIAIPGLAAVAIGALMETAAVAADDGRRSRGVSSAAIPLIGVGAVLALVGGLVILGGHEIGKSRTSITF